MALVSGNRPLGDAEIGFGSTGGTFGNLWPNGEIKTDSIVAGGDGADVETDVIWPLADVVIAGGGDVDLIFVQIFRYYSSPTKVEPIQAVGPTRATLQGARAE